MSTSTTNTVVHTVLVVDDEVLVRLVVAQQLRDCGYKVLEAASADEALTVLTYDEIKVDVVLSDVEMPGTMDGFALAAWIRTNRPQLKVVMAGTVARAVDAAVKLCEQGPFPGTYERQTLLRRITQLRTTGTVRRMIKSWRGLTTRMHKAASRRR